MATGTAFRETFGVTFAATFNPGLVVLQLLHLFPLLSAILHTLHCQLSEAVEEKRGGVGEGGGILPAPPNTKPKPPPLLLLQFVHVVDEFELLVLQTVHCHEGPEPNKGTAFEVGSGLG